ncbi:phosphorus acquisition-controlling protein [Aspergillus udagawae]|uniref:Phosphorus acquisition-controlling protein n=1 Tax=Aspergillus udagawae TaxID=91492 RepID=A0A8H3S5D4_9EURO|nr:phosphorus acquisition-controlling protein [Aspergillus udagawae]GFF46342.1 phosphorus acquisition-controlling protein [Aspergillus udagawae]GFG06402.1 phosphorus acquisition-controlling protein [Aspergillus udagawae]
MDQDNSMAWPGSLQEQSLMAASSEDEFTNFLEFGMHFPDLEGHGPGERQLQPPRSLPASVSMMPTTTAEQEQLVRMETDSLPSAHSSSSYNNRIMGDFSFDLSSHNQPSQRQGEIPSSYTSAPVTPAFYNQELAQPQMFHHPQQPPQKQLQQQPHHGLPTTSQPYIPHGQTIIPPTPNSIELQGNAARYPAQVDENHELYDRYPRMNEEQALYTPLVSPAMTPLETQFRLPEYTIPGEYFTPLTSPALEAQNSNGNGYPFQSVSEVGFLHSPADAIPGSSAPSSPGLMRKHRRRPSTTKSFSSRAKKQQSPSVRPQTRKKSMLNLNSDEVLNGLSQDQGVSKILPHGVSGLRQSSNESSDQDSVSPEPLSEPLMPPPALPPARKSPAIVPQADQSQTSAPATPAMLMRLQRPQPVENPTGQFNGQARLVSTESFDDVMEDVMLPEAATPSSQLSRPQVARIDTAMKSGSATPVTSASITPSLEPKIDRNPGSIAPSPRTMAMPSPSGPIAKKSETPKLGPMGRKRQSLSSTHASPNLRPKISPSIQPLVRGEGISSETSALYLASKSNYQHILDGTLLPGVSYPETLAENLSSKRTNHKLAEQGRRNRINNALKEIESLIPSAFIQMKHAKENVASHAKGDKEKEKEKAGAQTISKATTVELAIDYIKALKQELEETKGKLVAAEARMGENGAAKDEGGKAATVSPTEDGNTKSSNGTQGSSVAEAAVTSTEATGST